MEFLRTPTQTISNGVQHMENNISRTRESTNHQVFGWFYWTSLLSNKWIRVTLHISIYFVTNKVCLESSISLLPTNYRPFPGLEWAFLLSLLYTSVGPIFVRQWRHTAEPESCDLLAPSALSTTSSTQEKLNSGLYFLSKHPMVNMSKFQDFHNFLQFRHIWLEPVFQKSEL